MSTTVQKPSILDDRFKPNFTYDKLPEGFKKDWIGSLRSGSYKQVTGALYEKRSDNDCYCVLGVAGNNYGLSNASLRKTHSEFLLSPETRKKYGIPKEISSNSNLNHHLITMNDVHKFTFEEIADWIEKYL